jgi:WSC domain
MLWCSGYISIYQDPTFPPVDDTVISDYHYVGCYSEGVGGRALEYQQNLNTSTITVEECLFACKDGGFAFAGVEFASQCFCSVVLGNGSVPLSASSCGKYSECPDFHPRLKQATDTRTQRYALQWQHQ